MKHPAPKVRVDVSSLTGAGLSPRRAGQGFTLIELMVVIAIVAIMLAIAVPSFKTLIQQNRISSEVNTFVGDLQYARAEAIRRGFDVTMCPSSDGATCLTNNVWRTGWIIFSDNNSSKSVDSGDMIMRVQKAFSGTDTLAANPAGATAVTFTRDGFMKTGVIPSGTVTSVLTFALRTAPVDSSATKCVALNMAGRQTIQKPGAGACT